MDLQYENGIYYQNGGLFHTIKEVFLGGGGGRGGGNIYFTIIEHTMD